jgi:hypothetical protein
LPQSIVSPGERSVDMPRHKVDGETDEAAAKRDDQLVSRAAKRTDWAGEALEHAAGDLDDVGADETGLTALAETVQEEAEHVSRLAKDIESQRTEMDRKPSTWTSGTAEPLLRIGDVSVWALGGQRFRVRSPSGVEDIEGFAEARELAHELAGA